MSTPIIRPPTAVPANKQHSVRRPCVQLNCTSYLEQFTNYHSNSIHYQHFSTTPQDSSFLQQHRHRLTVTIRAYDSNFCFDIWRVTNADYLLTYLWFKPFLAQTCRPLYEMERERTGFVESWLGSVVCVAGSRVI